MIKAMCVSIALLLAVVPSAGAEEKVVRLDNVVVTGKKLVRPTKETGETVYTGSEITREGLAAQGARATVSVYEAIDNLPGVNAESVDPYGLGAEQKNIRVRGVRGYFSAMTVAGVPNWGGNPMGPREYIYDTENIESIAVYKGAVPADLGTGVGARGGALELRPRWPGDETAADIRQSIGGNGYTRTFLRLDAGALPAVNTRLAVSGSYTDAEKWKGPGDLGPRHNASFMLRQPYRGDDEIQLWFNYNDVKQDLYRPLAYAQVQRLGDNYKTDYNETLTGVKAQDIYYYQYNRGDYVNRDAIGVIPVTLSGGWKLNFKPYYSSEGTEILGGSTSQGGTVQRRSRDIRRYGLISQVDSDWQWGTAAFGYGYEANDMKIVTQVFDAGTLAFKGYGMYTENDGDGILHSPYLKLAGSAGRLDWQAGMKYFYYKDPASQGYTSPAPAYALVKAPDLYREEKVYQQWLPTIGLNYSLTERFSLYTSYGRNMIRPYSYMPLITLYNQQRAAFQAAGVTLNDLFEGYDSEITDSVELGARWRSDLMEIMPTVFYAKHQNLLTNVYDPRVVVGGKGVNYNQNVGKATGYGLELETNFFLGDHVTFFFNPTVTSLTYDENVVYGGTLMDIQGKQVVDTPRWMIKSGLILSYGDFRVIPMLRYLDERYGDSENTEKVDAYTVADLKIDYTPTRRPAFLDTLKVSLELSNFFSTEYVSLLTAGDYTLTGGGNNYYVGAPFTALLTVSLGI